MGQEPPEVGSLPGVIVCDGVVVRGTIYFDLKAGPLLWEVIDHIQIQTLRDRVQTDAPLFESHDYKLYCADCVVDAHGIFFEQDSEKLFKERDSQDSRMFACQGRRHPASLM